MINLVGAQTSTVSFLYELMTQWYLNLSGFVQVCCNAKISQFFFLAARSHSSLEVGHAPTAFLLFRDCKQGACCVVYHCMEKNIIVLNI